MWARKLRISLDGLEVGRTPMLVPAVSSRVNLPLPKLLDTIGQVVDGSILISAYDVHYSDDLPLTFPELIVLDSGGYECNKDRDVSDIGLYKPDPREWNEELHSQTVDGWSTDIPTLVVSFDHPSIRVSLADQIDRATNFFDGRDDILKEMLVKPETETSTRINTGNVVDNIDLLGSFDVIGLTEKELGPSVLGRMVTIAKIRNAMDEANIEMPIHVLGSLDTVTTPLYYMAGADIFDGLSWLRFLYVDGNTTYLDSAGPQLFGIEENVNRAWIRSVYQNYSYLRRLQLNLERFQSTGDFGLFGSNSPLFRESVDDLVEKVGGG